MMQRPQAEVCLYIYHKSLIFIFIIFQPEIYLGTSIRVVSSKDNTLKKEEEIQAAAILTIGYLPFSRHGS